MGIHELKQAFSFPKERPNVPLSDHGWFGPLHEDLLAKALKPETKLVFELGSWLGKSTRFIASCAPNATIVAIDNWKGLPPNPWSPNVSQFLPTLYETFITNCWDLKDRLIPVRTDTFSGMRICHEHGLSPDLIFIDASHEYKDVKVDIHHALSLFPNAALCGDDFLWPGVGRAVREAVAAGVLRASAKENVWWKESPQFTHMDGVLVSG